MKSMLAFLIILFACEEPLEYRITATALAREFRDNPVTGSEKYLTTVGQGIDLIIVGEIDRIGVVPFVGFPIIELAVQDSASPGIVIYFALKDRNRIAELRKTQIIAVKGRCIAIVDNKLLISSGKLPWQNIKSNTQNLKRRIN